MYCRPAGLTAPGARHEAVDVSRGGVRIYCDEPMKVGDNLTLALFLGGALEELDEPGSEVNFKAQVAWIEKLPKGAVARFDVGLKFLTLDPAAEALLAKVLGE